MGGVTRAKGLGLTSSYIREAIRSAQAIGIGDKEANIVSLAFER
jgi:hypothetical protein